MEKAKLNTPLQAAVLVLAISVGLSVGCGDSGKAEEHFAAAQRFDQSGRHAEAIAEYDTVLRLDPTYSEVYTNRGVAYLRQGQTGRAMADFDLAIQHDPDKAVAYANRGVAYVYLGETRRAVQDYNEAISIDPGFAKAYYNRALAYVMLERLELADSDAEKAIELGRDRTEVMAQLNKLKNERGQ